MDCEGREPSVARALVGAGRRGRWKLPNRVPVRWRERPRDEVMDLGGQSGWVATSCLTRRGTSRRLGEAETGLDAVNERVEVMKACRSESYGNVSPCRVEAELLGHPDERRKERGAEQHGENLVPRVESGTPAGDRRVR